MRSAILAIASLVSIATTSLTGCATSGQVDQENAIDESGGLEQKQLDEAFRRVVIARIYQHDQWTIPAADGYQPEKYGTLVEQRIHYVCDALAKLAPTYVSGLIRLDAGENPNEEQKAIYHGIRKCVREAVDTHPVVFDIVLNAKHYTEGAADEAAGRESIKKRIDSVIDDFSPNIVFFDFYSVPFDADNDGHQPWHGDVMQAGIHHIHDRGALVGGNVWGLQAPPGSDFAALDNFDRKQGCVDGFDVIKKQAAKLRDELPLLMHVENNPQNAGTHGLKFIDNGPAYRKAVVSRHSKQQDRVGYSYMYPVFFPLKIVSTEPTVMEAYDASRDGDMIGRMNELMHDEANRGNATATGNEHASEECAPTGAADERVFDPRFYLDLHDDVRAAFGDDVEAAKKHWKQYGLAEGRMASPLFHSVYYRQNNLDVDAAYPGDNKAVSAHFIEHGIVEARASSPIFHVDYYLDHNPDLIEAFGEMAYGDAVRHYLDYGLDEGRRASPYFDPVWYLASNPDVAAAYGATNYRSAIVHWLHYGFWEGRAGAP